jgi:hypothetical protein
MQLDPFSVIGRHTTVPNLLFDTRLAPRSQLRTRNGECTDGDETTQNHRDSFLGEMLRRTPTFHQAPGISLNQLVRLRPASVG